MGQMGESQTDSVKRKKWHSQRYTLYKTFQKRQNSKDRQNSD